ncbi:hypothetical protein BLOT_000189 [Blomia tropicalis]|nr:hypothetical protein BLOT_000189 [Blomia tropicalis]
MDIDGLGQLPRKPEFCIPQSDLACDSVTRDIETTNNNLIPNILFLNKNDLLLVVSVTCNSLPELFSFGLILLQPVATQSSSLLIAYELELDPYIPGKQMG